MGLQNTTLECFSWRVQSDSDGVEFEENTRHLGEKRHSVGEKQFNHSVPFVCIWVHVGRLAGCAEASEVKHMLAS